MMENKMTINAVTLTACHPPVKLQILAARKMAFLEILLRMTRDMNSISVYQRFCSWVSGWQTVITLQMMNFIFTL